MRKSSTVYMVVLILIVAANVHAAHYSFTPTSITATVGIPASINPAIGTLPLENGDEIAAFNFSGVCVGSVVWGGVNTALTIYGAEGEPTNLPGMNANEQILYRVWRASMSKEFPLVDVTYTMGNGSFQPNALFVLSSLRARAYELTIDIQPAESGILTPPAGTYLFGADEVVDIAVTPIAPYRFDKWSGGPVADSTASSTTVTMDKNKSVVAELAISSGQVDGRVWHDSNQNGLQDTLEVGMDGIIVRLYHSSGDVPFDSTVTAAGGKYSYNNLQPGGYFLEFVKPVKEDTLFFFTMYKQGLNDTLDSDVIQSTGRTELITLSPGDVKHNVDAGLYSRHGVTLTVQSVPPGIDIVVDGVTHMTPYSFTGLSGQTVTVATPTTYEMDGTRYTFEKWDDNGPLSRVVTLMQNDVTLTVYYVISHFYLSTSVSPEAGGSITPTPPGAWYALGDTAFVTATPNYNYVFTGFTGDAENQSVPQDTLIMDAPKSVEATFTLYTAVKDGQVPSLYNLISVYPNPFNHVAKIGVSVKAKDNWTLSLFNIRGELIKTWKGQNLIQADARFLWDGKNQSGHSLPSGHYFLMLTVDGRIVHQHKILMLK
ncbi:MAG: T9SS type A sorting domain-containing protein [Chitinivibrionales bacterium]|nr:T9SS type A sorting domain-containing protein [Chitinivibrionales bacterium]